MSSGLFRVPTPSNEPVRGYAPGSPERASLGARYDAMASEELEIPVIIGGREIRTGDVETLTSPHDRTRIIARIHKAGEGELQQAVEAGKKASAQWAGLPWEERAAVLLKAADLLAGPWRDTVNAATMLGQSKTAHQAEIDAACELIDFWRFNVHFAQQIMEMQPSSAAGIWNRTDVRPLEGFVLAVSPFNFTAIGGNLCTAPALMGNVVAWKPSMTAALSNYHVFKILERAGLPPGVINFLPSPGPEVGIPALKHRDLAGIHFTGSTGTFNWMWSQVGANVDRYRTYPRVVGETGGKDFIFVHASADPDEVATAILRGSFEYQGQKCSAASRLYIPDNLWAPIRDRVRAELAAFTVGDVRDFSTFMGAVIDERSFNKISGFLDIAQKDASVEVLSGGTADKERGWFVQPTFLRSDDPGHMLMTEEIFGPVVTAWVYPEARYQEALELCDKSAAYALTGSIFARDRQAIVTASQALRHAAGNFYINDKPTGAVVGQQPFGGSRKSGTNDKAGSLFNLLRWVSPRTIKETFVPPTDWRYPFLG